MQHIQDLTVRDSVFQPDGEELFQPVPTLQVFQGEECLINAVSLCDFSTDPCQLEICKCGQIGCKSGSWVSFRRINGFVLLIPAFRHLVDGDELERMDFQPPRSFISPDMSAAISVSDYSELVHQVPDLPSLDTILAPLRSEALRIAQLQAPLEVLGRFPETVKLKKKLLLAVSEGELSDEIRKLNEQLASAIEHDAYVTPAGSSDGMRTIEFHLDGPGFPSWSAFHRSDRGLALDLPPTGVMYL